MPARASGGPPSGYADAPVVVNPGGHSQRDSGLTGLAQAEIEGCAQVAVFPPQLCDPPFLVGSDPLLGEPVDKSRIPVPVTAPHQDVGTCHHQLLISVLPDRLQHPEEDDTVVLFPEQDGLLHQRTDDVRDVLARDPGCAATCSTAASVRLP